MKDLLIPLLFSSYSLPWTTLPLERHSSTPRPVGDTLHLGRRATYIGPGEDAEPANLWRPLQSCLAQVELSLVLATARWFLASFSASGPPCCAAMRNHLYASPIFTSAYLPSLDRIPKVSDASMSRR